MQKFGLVATLSYNTSSPNSVMLALIALFSDMSWERSLSTWGEFLFELIFILFDKRNQIIVDMKQPMIFLQNKKILKYGSIILLE
jgi:hypothetical protein